MLHTGEISEQGPVPSVAESQLRSRELREGATVALDQHVSCSVAFARGQERKVFFAIQGLPQVHSHLPPPVLCRTRPAPRFLPRLICHTRPALGTLMLPPSHLPYKACPRYTQAFPLFFASPGLSPVYSCFPPLLCYTRPVPSTLTLPPLFRSVLR